MDQKVDFLSAIGGREVFQLCNILLNWKQVVSHENKIDLYIFALRMTNLFIYLIYLFYRSTGLMSGTKANLKCYIQ